MTLFSPLLLIVMEQQQQQQQDEDEEDRLFLASGDVGGTADVQLACEEEDDDDTKKNNKPHRGVHRSNAVPVAVHALDAHVRFKNTKLLEQRHPFKPPHFVPFASQQKATPAPRKKAPLSPLSASVMNGDAEMFV
jgi:hypothetical protein